MNLTLLFIFVFYALILAVGLFASRHKTNDCEYMILAGRKLPLWIGALTMTATWVGGGYINGTTEAVAHSGLLWAQAPWGYALALVLGGLFFAKKIRDGNYTTMLDPFAKTYGNKIAALLFIPALIGELCWSAAILTALGATFAVLFNIDLKTAIISSSFVAIAYTYSGGLKSVAYTDALQLFMIFFGLLLTLPFLLHGQGGLSAVYQAYAAKMGDKALLFPTHQAQWSWLWADNALLLMLGGIPWGVYFQRVLASSSSKQATRLSFYAAIGCVILAFAPVVIGMVVAVTDWQALGLDTPAPAISLIAGIKYLAPQWVTMIALAAIAAAVMSSIDSSILSTASLFTWNVYKPLIYERGVKNIALDKMLKGSVVFFGGLATYIALSVGSIYTLWLLCSDLVYVILFPQLVALFYFKDKSTTAVISATVIGLTLRIAGGEPSLSLQPLLNNLDSTHFPIKTCAMLASLSILYLVPKLKRLKLKTMTSNLIAP